MIEPKIPDNYTSLRVAYLELQEAIKRATSILEEESADAKNCAFEWKRQFGPDHPALGYLEGKRSGIEESRLILEREIKGVKDASRKMDQKAGEAP